MTGMLALFASAALTLFGQTEEELFTGRHNEAFRYQHPTTWQVQESKGEHAISAHIVSPDGRTIVYIGAVKGAIAARHEEYHTKRVSDFLRGSRDWEYAVATKPAIYASGVALVTVLRNKGQGRVQYVSSFCAAGSLVLMAYEFDVSEMEAAHQQRRRKIVESIHVEGDTSSFALVTSPEMLNGEWKHNLASLAFAPSGDVTYVVLERAGQPAGLPLRQGRWSLHQDRLTLRWNGADAWPAKTESCSALRKDNELTLLCDGDTAPLLLRR